MFASGKMMMGSRKPIEQVSAEGSVVSSFGSSFTFLPITGAVGQLHIMILATSSEGITVTPPAGWTEVFDDGNFASSSLAVFYREILADDTGNQVFALSNNAMNRTYISLRYKNARWDTIGEKGTASGTTSPVAPGITVSKKGLLFCLASLRSSDSAWVAPPGMNTTILQETGQMGLAVFQQEISAGATGTRTPSNVASASRGAILFSIKGK